MTDQPSIKCLPTIQAKVLRGILNQVSLPPGIQSDILKAEQLSINDLFNYSAAIPLNAYMRIFDRLSKIANDPILGLNISQRMGPSLVGAIGFIFLASPDLKTGLKHLSAGIDTVQEASEISFNDSSAPYLQYTIHDENIRPRDQDIDFTLGYTYNLMKRYIGPTFAPKEVYFEHARSVPVNVYEHFFGCPVYFEQDMNAITLHEEDLQKSSAKSDPTLIPLLEHYIQLLDVSDCVPETLTENINQILSGSIEPNETSISYIAARIGLSPATLRRRLKAEGTTFRTILLRKRVAIAKRLLYESNLSILQIAERLGYSETASFTRSFQKETNEVPSQYRKRSKANL